MELGDRFDLWLVLRGGIRIRVGTMDELYASIGYGGINCFPDMDMLRLV